MQYKQNNGYKLYTSCRICNTPLVNSVIDMGSMPLAGGFLRSLKDCKKEKLYPLTLAFCTNCYTLQTREVIPPDILFKNYFYFSSSIQTLTNYFQKTAQELVKNVKNPQKTFIVEIGCNDGTFLKACKENGFHVLGVDPATNVVSSVKKAGITILNTYFDTQIAKEIIKTRGKADIIYSANTLAHIENIQDVFQGIHELLNDKGIFIFEVHDLAVVLKKLQFDMIYHEHQYYYSLHAVRFLVRQAGMEVFDVKHISTHGGSLRFYVKQQHGNQKIRKTISELLIHEEKQGLLQITTYKKYNTHLQILRKKLISLLEKIKKDKKTIVGYGASGRGTVISNYCGLDRTYLDYIVDDAPAKIGAYMPGTHLEIFSSQRLSQRNHPDYVILFAWSFYKEIKKKHSIFLKNGGKFILPLPNPSIL